MEKTLREIREEQEKALLCKMAVQSCNAVRKRAEGKCPIRTEFHRDRDRIIHSGAFRRLKHKTQVFLSPEGDHYRTRLTHTLEVSQIARTVARAMNLNEDLTEAIALGHDLGHTPFGHAGERALNEIYINGFRHYEQSVRVCEKLEKDGKGLNLTEQTLNGILCHTKGTEADTYEGRVVRICDQVAYINHDIDDAVRGGIITENDLPRDVCERFGFSKGERINSMVLSIIKGSTENIAMLEGDKPYFDKLHKYLFDAVYLNPKAKSEENKVQGIIEGLYSYVLNHPTVLKNEYAVVMEEEGIERAAVDYIAGMTDTFAVQFFENVYIPRSWHI